MLIKLPLVILLAAALILAVVRAAALRRPASDGPAAPVLASRIDNVAIWVAVLVPSSVVLGWHNSGLVVLIPVGLVLLWFLYRAAAPGPRPLSGSDSASNAGTAAAAPRSNGRGAAIYHLILTVVALWAAVSLADELGPHPAAEQLQTLIQHVIAWIVLLLAGVGWLLSAFATPGEPQDRPSRVQGVFEACLTVSLALCFLTVS